MRAFFFTLGILAVAVLLLSARSYMSSSQRAVPDADGFRTTSPQGHQPIKADIVNSAPDSLTIDVKKLANLGINDEAPTFAVYTTARLPDRCGDFTDLELDYQKPDQYTRIFDVSSHTEVIEAIDSYGCVVMKNIPPKG